MNRGLSFAEIPTTPPPEGANAVVRGVCRLFARNGIWLMPEVTLRNGRRADLMGLDGNGAIFIVEVKIARADLLGDMKWTDYLDYCDRFYWAVPPGLDPAPLDGEAFLPRQTGVIIADAYGAEIIRSAPSTPVPAPTRKAEMQRLARLSIRRLLQIADPLGLEME